MTKTKQIALLQLENETLIDENLQLAKKIGKMKENGSAISNVQQQQIKILIEQLELIGAK